jgi:copper(I)-binding protein
MNPRPGSKSRSAALAVAAFALAGLSACSATEPRTGAADASAPTCPLSVSDGWVKAADDGMTAAFGTLTNAGAAEVRLRAAATSAAARVELHEVVSEGGAMVMRQVAGGLAVPAGGTLALEPGGNHLMLMGLTEPVRPGDEVTLTLTCEGGGTATMTAQAKAYTGADEHYDQGASPSATGHS